MKTKISNLLFLLLLNFSAFAQNNNGSYQTSAAANQGVSQTHTEMLGVFYKNMNSYYVTNSPNYDQITKFFRPGFLCLRNSENINGKVTSVKWNSEEWLRELKATKDLNLRAERTIIKVVFERAIGSLANISAIMQVKYYQDTTLVADGYTFTSHSMVKENGEWKIENMTIDRITESQYIGVCPCKITKTTVDKNDQFLAKVMYPNGSSFETDEYQITFKGKGGVSIVTFGDNYYTWKDNVVYTAKIGGQESIGMVGKANSPNEVISLILGKNLYKNQCIRFEPIK